MKIKLIFAWYDLWLGAFYDRKNRRLYILPLPCVGIVIQFGARESDESNHGGEAAKERR